jgi:hypothetical protein
VRRAYENGLSLRNLKTRRAVADAHSKRCRGHDLADVCRRRGFAVYRRGCSSVACGQTQCSGKDACRPKLCLRHHFTNPGCKDLREPTTHFTGCRRLSLFGGSRPKTHPMSLPRKLARVLLHAHAHKQPKAPHAPCALQYGRPGGWPARRW